MRAVITGGGTAGHINPALAVAQELRACGHEVSYAGTPQGLEARLVAQEGFPYTAFAATGFNRRKPLTLLASSARVALSTLRARRWLAAVRPQVVVGFGGYVSIPVGLAASQMRIPLAIHEQNSTSGMANRFLARHAQLVALAYGSAACGFKTKGAVETVGNPVRASLFEADKATARAAFGLPQDATVLLAFGGSLGARHLNEALVSQAGFLLSVHGLHILHVTGTRDYDETAAALAQLPSAAGRWHLVGYCDRMGEAYAAADAVLSRAGATTLAELGALGMPALLVPYPYAAADEQTANARALVDAGAAALLADDELDTPAFIERLTPFLLDGGYRASLTRAALAHGNAQARQTLARLVAELAERHGA
ncbi:MAG: undecaprenyldiphospho-muramoylpentapeptide beta-N-acetylglucosaminyltransferase [Coriobacteriales bacterium]|jgi:UDP-N-acetylglucosamine--N-acetylmuramyl-(pentapeptide) pyrophosphoryl-undecaprenol N-acetylglucosamine transferase|nr:undecaprenyldiphospho-muramoylpentapeptide beta-N-acetylglucosaminyltransferase [Coriobacteriales bacterium]